MQLAYFSTSGGGDGLLVEYLHLTILQYFFGNLQWNIKGYFSSDDEY